MFRYSIYSSIAVMLAAAIFGGVYDRSRVTREVDAPQAVAQSVQQPSKFDSNELFEEMRESYQPQQTGQVLVMRLRKSQSAIDPIDRPTFTEYMSQERYRYMRETYSWLAYIRWQEMQWDAHHRVDVPLYLGVPDRTGRAPREPGNPLVPLVPFRGTVLTHVADPTGPVKPFPDPAIWTARYPMKYVDSISVGPVAHPKRGMFAMVGVDRPAAQNYQHFEKYVWTGRSYQWVPCDRFGN